MKINSFIVLLIILTHSMEQAQAEPSDPIITQGDSQVSQLEFDGRISKIPAGSREAFLRDGGRVEKTLRQMMMERRIADDARKAGFDKKPLVQERLKLAMESELADAWLDSIEASKTDAADFVAMAKEYYLTHPKEFVLTDSRDIAHIQIANTNRTDEEALKLAHKLETELKADPKQWDQFVVKYSDDPGSKAKQGKYAAVVPGKMVKPFEDAAFSLEQIGQLTAPVKTQFGYHLIRLDAINKAGKISFEIVKNKLVAQQKKMFARGARSQYMSTINTNEHLKIPPCAIEEMMTRYYADKQVKEAFEACKLNQVEN